MHATRDGQRIGEAAITARASAVGDDACGAGGEAARNRARRLLAVGDDRDVETFAAQCGRLHELVPGRGQREPLAPAHPAVDPQPIDVSIALHHPGVVVVGEQMNLRVGPARLQMREHRRGEQQVADLVAFDDQDFHSVL